MSFQITEAFVQQYSSQLSMLLQQKGSRLRSTVREESIDGKWGYVDRIGPTQTVKVTNRHGDSPLVSTPHDRRRINLDSEEWGDLIDRHDRVRTLISPDNPYMQNALYAFGRSIDEHILDACFADAQSGEEGGTTVSFPASQQVADGGANLTVAKLRAARELLLAANNDPDETWHIAVTASQLDNLLTETEVTSSDFNTVKALVNGEINTYLGFNFHHTELVRTTAAGLRRVPAYTASGMTLGVGMDVNGRIDPARSDKRFSTYVYASMDIGATRLEEPKVVEILCDES